MVWIDDPLMFGKPQSGWLQLWHDAPVKISLADHKGGIFEAVAWSKRVTKQGVGMRLEKGKPIAPFVMVDGKPDFRQALVLPWRSTEESVEGET